MEISFDSKETVIYREYSHQSRRVQESAECVVPDTDADIEKIAAVQSGVLLKSKDLSSRGVLLSGELYAVVVYIRDGQTGLSDVHIRKPFTVEFEAEGLESERLAQAALWVQGADVRLVNPRKLSVQFEVEAELSCYRSESLRVDASLPENVPGLHARTETQTLTLPNAVCEKSVALNEQFPFPADGAPPERLIQEKAALLINDCQLLGSKMIVKGSAEIAVSALTAQRDRPIARTFSAPFSQIIDVGVESAAFTRLRPEITGSYFDLIDTINGEKALDMELHAVLQLVCSEERGVRRITDAYSNLMPAELVTSSQEFMLCSAPHSVQLEAEERISLMEECGELLQVFPSLTRLTAEGGKLGAALALDFLYRNGEGKLSACRRTLALTSGEEETPLQLLRVGQLRLDTKPDGEYVDCKVTLELVCQERIKKVLTAVDGVILDEEKAYVQGSLPTLTLVRREGESLWTLARYYHSSEEKIRELNEDADTSTRMLLVPKCV